MLVIRRFMVLALDGDDFTFLFRVARNLLSRSTLRVLGANRTDSLGNLGDKPDDRLIFVADAEPAAD
jgi:hypothetical protein